MGSQPRTRALDGLRGLAALSVVAFHVWLYRPERVPGTRTCARRSGLLRAAPRPDLLLRAVRLPALPRAAAPAGPQALRRAPDRAHRARLLRLDRRLPDPVRRARPRRPRAADRLAAALPRVRAELLRPTRSWRSTRSRGRCASRRPSTSRCRWSRSSRSGRARVTLLVSLIGATVAWNALTYGGAWTDVSEKTLPAYAGHFALGMLVALWVESRRERAHRRWTGVLAAAGVLRRRRERLVVRDAGPPAGRARPRAQAARRPRLRAACGGRRRQGAASPSVRSPRARSRGPASSRTACTSGTCR